MRRSITITCLKCDLVRNVRIDTTGEPTFINRQDRYCPNCGMRVDLTEKTKLIKKAS